MGLTTCRSARALASAPRADELPEAGELLAVEAIDRTGLVVTSEGAFVRVLRVTPANPLILVRRGPATRSPPASARLLGRLRAGPVAAVLRRRAPDPARRRARPSCAAEVEAAAGPRADARPARARRDRALALAAVRGDGAVAAPARRRAGRGRGSRAYVVDPVACRGAPRRPRRARGAGAPARRWSASVHAHRRAVRESQAHVDALRAELEALGLPVRQLNGGEVFAAAVGAR